MSLISGDMVGMNVDSVVCIGGVERLFSNKLDDVGAKGFKEGGENSTGVDGGGWEGRGGDS